MNNISFKANLIIDDSLRKKMPQGTPEGYIDELAEEYKKFLNHPVIDYVTEGDTITLYKDHYGKGFALGIKFQDGRCNIPMKSTIAKREKIPNIKPAELIFQTYLYLLAKSDVEQNFFEKHSQTFKRVLEKLIQDRKRREENSNF